jgi:hypothetical protein
MNAAASLVYMVKLFLSNALDWLCVKCPQTIDACHNAAFEISHANLRPIKMALDLPITSEKRAERLALVFRR